MGQREYLIILARKRKVISNKLLFLIKWEHKDEGYEANAGVLVTCRPFQMNV
jgi:hypothetical protein